MQRAIALQGAGAVSNNPPTFSDEELAAELEPFEPTPEEREFLIRARRRELSMLEGPPEHGPTNANVLCWVELSDLNRRVESYLGPNRFKIYQRIQTPGCAALIKSERAVNSETMDRYVRLYWDYLPKTVLAGGLLAQSEVEAAAYSELIALLDGRELDLSDEGRFPDFPQPSQLKDQELAAELAAVAPRGAELEWLLRARNLEREILAYYLDPSRSRPTWSLFEAGTREVKEKLGSERFNFLNETKTPGYRQLYVALRRQNSPDCRDALGKYVALYRETERKSSTIGRLDLTGSSSIRAQQEGARKLIALVGREIYDEIRIFTGVFDPPIPVDRPLGPMIRLPGPPVALGPADPQYKSTGGLDARSAAREIPDQSRLAGTRLQPPLASADIVCFANRPLDFCYGADLLESRLTGRRPPGRANLDFGQLGAFLDHNITNEATLSRIRKSSGPENLLPVGEVQGVFFTQDGTGYHYLLVTQTRLRISSNDPYPTERDFTLAEPVGLVVWEQRLSKDYIKVSKNGQVARFKLLDPEPIVALAVPAKEDILFFANGPERIDSPPRERVSKELVLGFLGEGSESRVLSREESVELWRKRSGSKLHLPLVRRDGALATKEKKVIFWELLADDMLFLEDEPGASCLLLKGDAVGAASPAGNVKTSVGESNADKARKADTNVPAGPAKPK